MHGGQTCHMHEGQTCTCHALAHLVVKDEHLAVSEGAVVTAIDVDIEHSVHSSRVHSF